jgi:hypothetical protein
MSAMLRIGIYKLVIFEFVIVVLAAGLTTFTAGTEGMTTDKWREIGNFGHMRLYSLMGLAMLTAAKAYTSKAMSNAETKMDVAQTQIWKKGGV